MSVSYSDCFSDLLCGEDSDTVFSNGGGEDLPECSSSDIESQFADIDESIAGLIEDEQNFVPGFDYIEKFQSQSLSAAARDESVAWILKVQRHYGFQPLTAYLAVNYFDRFLYSRSLPQTNGWPLQLLSVACLSLAAKMEEPLVPSLLDLQVEGAKYIFEPKTIQRMEFLVLRILDWRLRSITPFSFLSFFAAKLDSLGTFTAVLISRASQIILSNIQEASFHEYWPSCIAAATILCAAKDLPNFSLVNAEHAESWCHGLRKDKIVGCYELVQKYAIALRPRRFPRVYPQETKKFRTELLKKLSKEKEILGDELDDVVSVCAEIFNEFLHKDYGGPGTLLVEPFTDMMVALKERKLSGAASAARASLLWAQNYVDQDWETWNSKHLI